MAVVTASITLIEREEGADSVYLDLANNRDRIQLGMLFDHSDFATAAAGKLYVCGLVPNGTTGEEELTDVNGSILNAETGAVTVVPKQTVDLTAVPPGTAGYLIYDSADSLVWFISYSEQTAVWVRRNAGQIGDGTALAWNEAIHVIGELTC